MARRISVEIVGDDASLRRAFRRSAREADRFNRSITGTIRTTRGAFGSIASGLGVGGLGLGAAALGIKETVDAASDLNEQLSRTRVVFDQSAAAVVDWSETTATALGIAQREALQAAGNFGGMFRTMGIASDRAADMSQELVQLAADMASFNNEDPSDMLDRLRSGLAGEAEPLRRFQILLSEARVRSEAYRAGIARQGTALTEQQKVLARYNLILQDSALQQGDFARTSENLANQQRILTAQLGDLATELGAVLLPKVTETVRAFNDWLADPENRQRVIEGWTGAVGLLGAAFTDVADSVQDANRWFHELDRQAEIADNNAAELGNRVLRNIVGPLSHLSRLDPIGKWARKTKEDLEADRWEIRDAAALLGRNTGEAFGQEFARSASEHFDQVRAGLSAVTDAAAADVPEPPPTVPRGATVEQRNRWFDSLIGRELDIAQDLALQQQIRRLREIAAMIEQRIAITRDITRKLNLEAQLRQVQRQIRAAMEQAEDQAAAEREEAREKRRLARERELARLRAQQFAVLGLGPTGGEVIPNAASLRKRLQQLGQLIPGTALDTGDTRSRLRQLRELFARNWKAMDSDVRSFVDNILDEWDRLLREQNEDATRFKWRGSQAPGESIAFTGRPGAIVIHGDLHFTGVQNMRQLEAEIARRSRSRPKTRRGAG